MGRRNRKGSGHNNRISHFKNDYSRAFDKRRHDEEAAENPPSDAAKVKRVNWYITDNAKTHNTMKFDLIHDQNEPKPVLRRGQKFYVAITFLEDFDVTKVRVALYFNFGFKGSVPKGTLAVVPVQNMKFTRTEDDWDCRIDPGTRGKDLIIEVQIPANAMVGIWRLDVHSGLYDTSRSTTVNLYHDETNCYILFNPWCKNDAVYLHDEAKRDEYIMNDNGKVYVGAYRHSRGRPWAYGQFDDVVLPVAMDILEHSRIADSERGNPVKVVRGISAGVNCYNKKGILEGNWSGEYSDGVAPNMWTGSAMILEKYVTQGFQPVKYGQCWVFSALVTTICRSLGIPCRSVTNFVSAHDTNSSLTIDKFFDKEGKELKGGPDGNIWDSIWNFHAWNDVWMERSDLPFGYGGWQAIESTPKVERNYEMQCGPVSLQALRRGEIGHNYDAPFVFAKVNAEVIYWGEDKDSDWGWSRMKTHKYGVGRQILTKKVGKDDDNGDEDQEDVLNDYKSEGSIAERLSTHNAISGSHQARQYFEYRKDIIEDVAFDLIDIDKIMIGQPIQIKVVVRNESNEPRNISAHMTAQSVYYNGVNVSTIKEAEENFILEPEQSKDVPLIIEYNEYWKKLVEQCMIKIYATCRVQQTGQIWTDEDDFQLEKPKLMIQTPDEAQMQQSSDVSFSFTNPLDMPLTKGHLSVDGPGLTRSKAIDIATIVPAGENFTHSIKILPIIHGKRKLIAVFNSKELFEIIGTKTIQVRK